MLLARSIKKMRETSEDEKFYKMDTYIMEKIEKNMW